MDKIYGTEAARILGVSRSTMLRMDEQKRLPADGVDDDGSRFWHRSTVLDYLAGRPKRSTFAFVRSSLLPGICVSEQHFKSLITGKTHPVDLTESSDAVAVVELCNSLRDLMPASVAVAIGFASHPCFSLLCEFASEIGVSVLLVSSD